MGNKGKKLRPRDPDKLCGAGDPPCRNWKGLRTSHPGVGRCYRCGGATPNHEKAAEREMVKQHARTYGTPIEIDPLNGLLSEVRRSAGVVAWLETRVGNLTEDGSGENLLDATMFGPKVSVWIQQYEKERAHFARVCKMAIDSGVAQELLDIMKSNGRALGQFVAAVLGDERLALTPEQLTAARSVVQEHTEKAISGTNLPH